MYRDFVDVVGKYIPIEKGNAYGLYHAQALYEGQRSATEEKRVVNLTRNGYLGSQKYGTILWSGDTYASGRRFVDKLWQVSSFASVVCHIGLWILVLSL